MSRPTTRLERFAAFDALPHEVREALRDATYEFSTIQAKDMLAMMPARAVVARIRQKDKTKLEERQRQARDTARTIDKYFPRQG